MTDAERIDRLERVVKLLISWLHRELGTSAEQALLNLLKEKPRAAHLTDAVEPVEPMTVLWDILPEEWVCAAKDENNTIFGFTSEPAKQSTLWAARIGTKYRRLDDIGLATPGTVPWKDSLQRRPKEDRG